MSFSTVSLCSHLLRTHIAWPSSTDCALQRQLNCLARSLWRVRRAVAPAWTPGRAAESPGLGRTHVFPVNARVLPEVCCRLPAFQHIADLLITAHTIVLRPTFPLDRHLVFAVARCLLTLTRPKP